LQLVIDPPFRASEAGAWVDPHNRLWLFWNFHPLDLQRPGGQLWAMTARNADEAKPAWDPPRLIALEMVNINKPTVLSDGSWIIPALSTQWAGLKAMKKPPSAPIGHLSRPLISKDEGETFKVGGEIPVADSMRNFDEYQVVERKDGSLWLLNRTLPAPDGIGESFSFDGGETWTEMRHTPIKHTSSRIFFTRLASGHLLLVKNGDLDDGSGRHRMTAFVSRDEGQSWEGGLLLDERATSYPDGAQAADGTIYIAYDHERTRAKEILLARFTEEDILAGRIVSEQSKLKLLINKATGEVDPNRDNFISEGLVLHMQAMRALQGETAASVPSKPFVKGQSPSFDLHSHAVAQFKAGSKIYTDRVYSLSEVPAVLEDKQMVVMPISGGRLHVLDGGMVYVASPSPARDSQGSLERTLIQQGFSKTDVPEFLAFEHPLGPEHDDSVRFSIYQRPVAAGEMIHIGKSGIVIF